MMDLRPKVSYFFRLGCSITFVTDGINEGTLCVHSQIIKSKIVVWTQ